MDGFNNASNDDNDNNNDNSNNNNNNNNNNNDDLHVALKFWVGIRWGWTLQPWLATFLGERKLGCKTRVRKTLYPWLAIFQREEISNTKLKAGESLALVDNNLEMVSR